MIDASKAARYRKYAEEALHFAGESLSEKDKQGLREIAQTWSKIADACEGEELDERPRRRA